MKIDHDMSQAKGLCVRKAFCPGMDANFSMSLRKRNVIQVKDKVRQIADRVLYHSCLRLSICLLVSRESYENKDMMYLYRSWTMWSRYKVPGINVSTIVDDGFEQLNLSILNGCHTTQRHRSRRGDVNVEQPLFSRVL